jgi:hypothetical protein
VRKLVFLLVALASSWAAAAAPAEGVELKVRRGFFTETDIGAFFTLGGDQAYSNTQTYVQLAVGYDISDSFALSATFGIGASAADCFGGRKTPGDTTTDCVAADNFTAAFFDLNGAYLFRLAERFYLYPKLAIGYTTMDPAPVCSSSSPAGECIGINSGVNLGGGVGIEYATSMDHFSIGLEAMYRFVIGPNISAVSIFPRVKYTF